MPRIFINLEAGCLQVNPMSTSAQINQLKYTILYYTIASANFFIYHLIRTQDTILSNHATKQKRKKELQSIVKTKCYNTTSCTNVV